MLGVVMTNNEYMRRRLLCDVVDEVTSPNMLRASERDREFERLCANRKVIGAMRYGLFGAADKPVYDRVAYMLDRLQAYKHDRNAEHLVDVANTAELEFVEGNHRGVLAADDGYHYTVI